MATGASAREGSAGPDSSAKGKQKASPSVPPWASLASGAASGAASCLLLQPMDLLKTRMQQQQEFDQQLRSQGRPTSEISRNAGAIDEGSSKGKQQVSRGGPSKRTARLVAVARQVVHDDGWQGLWRGTVPTVARNVPGVALYFYSVSEIRALLSRSEVPLFSFQDQRSSSSSTSAANRGTLARLTVAGNLASGAVARVAVGFVLSPITIVKARFESSHFSKQDYPTLGKAIAEVYHTGGVRGLFRGFTATALRDAPYAGLYLAIYEKVKDGLARTSAVGGQERGSTTVVSASGVIAGTMATLLTHPFDILKTRIQTMPEERILAMSTRTHHGRPVPPSLMAMTRHIIANEGSGAFLDGLGLRCARKAASSAIGWTIFEGGRELYVRQFAKREARTAGADAEAR